MNRDHSYYPYNNNEQPLEVEWQAPEQNDIWEYPMEWRVLITALIKTIIVIPVVPESRQNKSHLKTNQTLGENCLWCSSMFGNISRLHWWIHRFGKYGSNPIFRFRYKQFQFYCEYYQSRK